MQRTLPIIFALIATAAIWSACDPKTDDSNDPSECVEAETRCFEEYDFEKCEEGIWTQQWYCPTGCEDTIGCVACNPNHNGGLACDGNDVVRCTQDGRFGAIVDQCTEDLVCVEGECEAACTAEGVDLIYVIDTSYRLLSFDPRKLDDGDDPFQLIGQMDCTPSFPNVPGWGGGGVTPFSMSVDREGFAWVLYTSGEIFHVDIGDASCESSDFQRMQSGNPSTWLLFGMGFSTDEPGGQDEHLYLAGGSTNPNPGGMFGFVDPATLMITTSGSLPTDVEYSPEFTGNGKAELFAYFPGTVSIIRELDRTNGVQIGADIDAGSVAGGVRAWAFAYWGDKFYVFVTDGLGNSQVLRSDRETGAYEGVIRQNLPYIIVGAGVSTCAPTVDGS